MIVTRYGKPVAQLVPYDEQPSRLVFGWLKSSVLSYGDVITPIEEGWDASA